MPAKWAQAAVILGLAFFGYLFTLNPTQVDFRVYPGGHVRASLALLLFMTFAAGFGVAFLTGVFREAFFSLRTWRHAKADGRKDDAQRLLRTGRGSIRSGRHRAARRLLRKAFRKAPGEPSIATEMARAELGDGRLPAAEKRLKALLEDDPRNPEILSLLTEVYRAAGNVEGQVTTLSQWSEADPSHRPSLEALRDLYRSAGKWAEAVKVQEKLLGRTSGREGRSRERRVLAELLLRASRGAPPAEAATTLRRVVEGDRRLAAGHAALGDALLACGDEEGCVRTWLKGYGATGQKGLLLKVEQFWLQRGEGERMLKLYKKLARRDPGAAFLRARLLIALNRSEEALEALGKPRPSLPAARWLAGEAFFRLRSYDEAARSFRESLGAASGPPPMAFRCSACGRTQGTWAVQCPACGVSDALELDLDDLPAPPTAV